MATLCHYRGRDELPCVINPYYTSREDFAAARFDGTKKFYEIRGGVAFIHIKRDDNKPCFSFNYGPHGIGVYRYKNLTFVGFTFAYFTSLMLLVDGKGTSACYAEAFGGSKFCKEDAIADDISDSIIEMEDVNVSSLTRDEAASILAAMENHVAKLVNPDACIGFEEEREVERPKWDTIISALRAKAAEAA